MNRFFLIFFSVVLSIVGSSQVLAISITPAIIEVSYVPGETVTKAFQVGNTEGRVKVEAMGILSTASSISASELVFQPGEAKTITVTFTIPSTLEPGKHYLDVKASELGPENPQAGTNMATGSIIGRIRVEVPYPGKYVDLKLKYSKEIKWKDPLKASIMVTNQGRETIDTITGTLKITDDEHTLVGSAALQPISSLPAQESKEMFAVWDSSAALAGIYYVSADVIYDGNQAKVPEHWLSIGSIFLEVLDFGHYSFPADSISPMSIQIKNWWNKPLEMYARIFILDEQGKALKKTTSPTLTLDRLKTEPVEFFVDTKGIVPGTYDSKLVLFYENEETPYNFTLTVTEADHALAGAAVSTSAASRTSSSSMPWTAIALVGMVLIILSVFLYLRYRRGEEEI